MMIYYMVSVVGLFLAAIWYVYTTEMRIAENVNALDIKLKVLKEDLTLLLSHIEYKKRKECSDVHNNVSDEKVDQC